MSTKNAGSTHDDLERLSMQGVIEMLTLALLRLTAREKCSGGTTCLYADRTYDQAALDSLQERGYVKLGGKSKPIQLTEEGADMGDSVVLMVDDMLAQEAEAMLRDLADSVARQLELAEATDAYRLRVEFAFDSELSCWREIAVPNNFSFLDLHRLLQVLWNWNDYHCFDFRMRSGGKNLVLTDEDSKYCIDAMFAGFRASYAANTEEVAAEDVMLRDVFPRTKNVTYHYDYGDAWECKIKYLGVLGEAAEVPFVIDGSGDCPPEDVGSERGFIEFLETIANPDDPEYEETLEWGEGQGYEVFDREVVNDRLADAFEGYFDREGADELRELMESLGSEEALIEYLAQMSFEDDEDEG